MASRLGLCSWLVAAFALAGAPAWADYSGQSAELCERAIVEGARRGEVPQDVLHAISLTETGRSHGGRMRPWPWAVNREGRGHWFATRDEALAFARASIAEGRHSFDLGCFQINYHWHGDAFPSVEAMLDPDLGAAYAARFLRGLYQERGDWSAAAGAYHSQTPAFAQVYRARFDRIRAGLGGAPLTVAGETEAAPRKSRTRMSRGPLIITVPKPDAPPPPQPFGDAAADVGPERGGRLRLSQGPRPEVAANDRSF